MPPLTWSNTANHHHFEPRGTRSPSSNQSRSGTPLVNWKPSHSDLNQSSQLSLLFPGDLVPETTMREPNTRKSRGTTNHLTIRLKNSEILAIPRPLFQAKRTWPQYKSSQPVASRTFI
ncbi:hypothetical protein KEM48_011779 [Puccinia striiformis f. sp. tritici PST-130]|nr:hypothetical protein KEM48_011779 [Puccinia striiformis f. sp. tritici PST-130]